MTGADRDDIQSAADLEGKRVAVNGIGAAIEYWVDQALVQEGLSIEDVELTAMRFPDMPAALANGSLDAAVITEPLVTINEEQGLVKVLAEDFINGFTATYLMALPFLHHSILGDLFYSALLDGGQLRNGAGLYAGLSARLPRSAGRLHE